MTARAGSRSPRRERQEAKSHDNTRQKDPQGHIDRGRARPAPGDRRRRQGVEGAAQAGAYPPARRQGPPRRRDDDIADVLSVGTATVERVRKQCVLDGREAALERKVQVNRKQRLLDGVGEARLTMLACSALPEGQAQWTLQLLADRLVALEVVETISTETVRRTLKKTTSSPG